MQYEHIGGFSGVLVPGIEQVARPEEYQRNTYKPSAPDFPNIPWDIITKLKLQSFNQKYLSQ